MNISSLVHSQPNNFLCVGKSIYFGEETILPIVSHVFDIFRPNEG